VFDTSFAAITREKLARVTSREPICKRCFADPYNQLIREHAAANRGAPGADPPALLERVFWTDTIGREVARKVMASQRRLEDAGARPRPRPRRRVKSTRPSPPRRSTCAPRSVGDGGPQSGGSADPSVGRRALRSGPAVPAARGDTSDRRRRTRSTSRA
jgi:hypothetical protein